MEITDKIILAYDRLMPSQGNFESLKEKASLTKKEVIPFYKRPALVTAFSISSVTLIISGCLLGNALISNDSLQMLLASPNAKSPISLKGTDANKIAISSLKLLSPISDGINNSVVSPIGFSLLSAGYSLVSSNSESAIEQLGFSNNYEMELTKLLEVLNWSYHKEGNSENKADQAKDSSIRSLILYQIIDSNDTFSFDEDYQQKIADNHISTLLSEDNYLDEAEQAIKEAIDDDIQVPPFYLKTPGVTAYSVLTLKDSAEFDSTTFTFNNGQVSKTVDGANLDDKLLYYETDIYQAISLPISYTDLVFILPKEDFSLTDIDLASAYEELLAYGKTRRVIGKVPYFSLSSLNDLTPQTQSLMKDSIPYDKLVISSDASVMPTLDGCLQDVKFTFNKHGVSGSAITMYNNTSQLGDKPIEFVVDRPFLAISTYENLPLFAMSIINPEI